MSKRLGKVAQKPSLRRIILFRQKTDIVAQIQKALKQSPRVIVATEQREVVGEPEGTRQEQSLARRQAIHFLFRRISGNKTFRH